MKVLFILLFLLSCGKSKQTPSVVTPMQGTCIDREEAVTMCMQVNGNDPDVSYVCNLAYASTSRCYRSVSRVQFEALKKSI